MDNEFSTSDEHFLSALNENYFEDLFSSTQVQAAVPLDLNLSIIPNENQNLADISQNYALPGNHASDESSLTDFRADQPCTSKKTEN